MAFQAPLLCAVYVQLSVKSADACIHVQSDEASFKRKAKKSLTSALTERVPALMAPMTTSHAEALRRCMLSPLHRTPTGSLKGR